MEINSIYLGDCLELMKDIAPKTIDFILCDPPFGTTQNKWDKVIDFKKIWEQYNIIIKDNGCIALFANPPFDKILACSNLIMYKYDWVIEYTTPRGFLNAKKRPLNCCDYVLVFYKQPPLYNPQKTTGHPRKVSKAEHKSNCIKTTNYGNHNFVTYDSTERYPRNIIKFSTDKQKSKLHPTQKPTAVLEYLIKTYTNENQLVLDNCIGSGSTCIACLNTNRNYIGIEKDEKYFEISRDRIEKHFKEIK